MSESQLPPAAPATPALQFDRAVTSDAAAPAGVTCAACRRPIVDSYFTLGQQPFCASCKASVEAQAAGARTGKSFATAAVFGLGAAIAGAAVYYAVIAITNFEIGIVAILIGWMVGWAIRKATHGFGGRRYQILGAALTYLAVSLAYLPLAMKGSQVGGVASVIAMAVMALALPVMVIVSSLPSGLLSALIIGIGIRQAWRMTAAPQLSFHGPLKVTAPGAPA